MTKPTTRMTKEAILEAYNKLQATLPAGKLLTRDKFRKESGVPVPDWEFHFGTFNALKSAAGVTVATATDRKVLASIAKSELLSVRDALDKERKSYGDRYTRTDNKRYKTLLVCSDLHDKEVDPFTMRVIIETAKRAQPDIISLGGDVFDLPEWGKYPVDPREWDAVGRIQHAHDHIFKPLREAAPDAQIDLIEGNHECVTPETEVLTDRGWKKAIDISRADNVASFNLPSHSMRYEMPVEIRMQKPREVFEIETTFKKERITGNHRIVYDGQLTHLESIDKLEGQRMLQAIWSRPKDSLDMDEWMIRFAVWVMTHGTINVTDSEYKYWLSFNKIPKRIERRIKAVVSKIRGIKWEKVRNGLEVEGPALAGILELITGKETIAHGTQYRDLPDWFEHLDPRRGPTVGEELTWASTQGFMAPRTSYFKGHQQAIGEKLQWFLVTRGVPCAMHRLEHDQYTLVFNETPTLERWRGKRVTKKSLGDQTTIAIQTVDGTLVTRLDGKINFTGNCRLVKNLTDMSPATRALLGDLHGWTMEDLFKLREFKVNYVAKADLKSYSAKEHMNELEHNYRIYHGAFLVHHFPQGRALGLPGVNGHHHSHIVWPQYNVHRGAYEWHQLGAGHRRSAVYAEGEKWSNGFALVHIDTLTKGVNIEYIPVTDFAVVGGTWYTREPHEVVVQPIILGD